jgi:hypothetical protein
LAGNIQVHLFPLERERERERERKGWTQIWREGEKQREAKRQAEGRGGLHQVWRATYRYTSFH